MPLKYINREYADLINSDKPNIHGLWHGREDHKRPRDPPEIDEEDDMLGDDELEDDDNGDDGGNDGDDGGDDGRNNREKELRNILLAKMANQNNPNLMNNKQNSNLQNNVDAQVEDAVQGQDDGGGYDVVDDNLHDTPLMQKITEMKHLHD